MHHIEQKGVSSKTGRILPSFQIFTGILFILGLFSRMFDLLTKSYLKTAKKTPSNGVILVPLFLTVHHILCPKANQTLNLPIFKEIRVSLLFCYFWDFFENIENGWVDTFQHHVLGIEINYTIWYLQFLYATNFVAILEFLSKVTLFAQPLLYSSRLNLFLH